MSLKIFLKIVKLNLSFLFCILTMILTSSAQSPVESNSVLDERIKNKINANTVTILSGSITGTYIRLIDDIARGIGEGDNLRILPIRGATLTNIRDTLYLRGIDMAIIRSDDIDTHRNKPYYRRIKERLRYITALHKEEFHLIVSDPEIKSAMDLNGKVVSTTNLSSQLVLKKIGVKASKFIPLSFHSAVEKMKTGEIDAIIRITGKPFSGVDTALKINQDLRIIPIPFVGKLLESQYLPTTLTHDDYPKLIKKGVTVNTVALTALLGVYNWQEKTDRYRRLEKFTKAFFENYDKILKRSGRHAKWDSINLTTNVSGWKRFKPAQEMIKKIQRKSGNENSTSLREKFQKFLEFKRKENDANGTSAANNPTFSEFKEWIQQQ